MATLADVVLLIHFAVAALITAGLLLIPVGGVGGWRWVRWRRLRIAHVTLMLFVAFESVIGVACPLTLLEATLRQSVTPESFWAYHLQKWLYWDLPLSFFIVLYLTCAAWAVFLWWWIPPDRTAGCGRASPHRSR